jgi:hypothetical protein
LRKTKSLEWPADGSRVNFLGDSQVQLHQSRECSEGCWVMKTDFLRAKDVFIHSNLSGFAKFAFAANFSFLY